ncbi:LPS export ABC transporter permease LptF [Microbaculum marinum]|uniref:LPS export ABC transporter permease LptF n=1 Tax=Microbaculum marinum TaxID=1764581 RepID=A0AAW9RWL8_9HYPH
MNLIGRYIFRIAAGAFVISLLVLTGVVWVTQALKEIDLLTTQGQTLWLFMYMTVLALPALVMVIAPVGLFIACLYTLNRINADSELVVINAAGSSPWLVYKPFVVLGLIVTLLTAGISLYVMPESARTLRNTIAQIRADVLTYIVVEGLFTTVEDNLTFHIRDRAADGTLLGLLVHDARDPEQIMTYLAEEGRIIRTGDSAYLVMNAGSMHQQEGSPEEITVIRFDRYIFDLSNLTVGDGTVEYRPREMRMSELLNPDPEDPYFKQFPGKFRSEVHERLSSILYPLSFVFISLATLGYPRTNRTGRGNSILLAIVAVGVLRTIGFSASNIAARESWAVGLMYLTPVVGIVGSAWIAFGQGRRMARIMDAIPVPQVSIETLHPRHTRERLEALFEATMRRLGRSGWGTAR